MRSLLLQQILTIKLPDFHKIFIIIKYHYNFVADNVNIVCLWIKKRLKQYAHYKNLLEKAFNFCSCVYEIWEFYF
jgi:hypothetical protein